MKLVVREAESAALRSYVERRAPGLATSRIAIVELLRAAKLAHPGPESEQAVQRLLDACLLVDVTDALLRQAAALTSRRVRTLDAIHLASARHVGADELLVYDRRLAAAAGALGLRVVSPGTA